MRASKIPARAFRTRSTDAALQVFGMSHDELDSLCSRLREEAETP